MQKHQGSHASSHLLEVILQLLVSLANSNPEVRRSPSEVIQRPSVLIRFQEDDIARGFFF